MTDHHPDDDLIRDSLRAEADGIHAGDHMLDRIRSEATRPSRIRQVGPWLLAGAAVVAAVALVATVLQDDKPETVDTAGDPPTTEEAPPVDTAAIDQMIAGCGPQADWDLVVYFQPGATPSQIEAVEVDHLQASSLVDGYDYVDQQATYAEFRELFADHPNLVETVTPEILPPSLRVDFVGEPPISEQGALASELKAAEGVYEVVLPDCPPDGGPSTPEVPEQPTLVALVREDGWLVTVDLATGEETELHSVGDPRDEREGGPYYIDAVDLSPDGQWIYFSTCCEPASGNTYRMPVTGGEPELFAVGAYPRVSPDGRLVATGAAQMVIVTAVDKATEPAVLETGCCVSRLSWSPDGSRLAFVYGQGSDGGDFLAGVLDWDGATVTMGGLGKPETSAQFVTWMPDGTPVMSDGEPIADDRTLSQDPSYHWLLAVDENGTLKARPGHESPEQIELRTPKALAADW